MVGRNFLLEPFIDTVIICMLTGMVLLSSGVWKEKYQNRFQAADMQVLWSVLCHNCILISFMGQNVIARLSRMSVCHFCKTVLLLLYF